MKKLLLSIFLVSLVFAGGLFAQETSSYCFEPRSRLILNALFNFPALASSDANTTTADGYLYIKMPENPTDMISLKPSVGQVEIEFSSNDTSYISSHLDYLNSLGILLYNPESTANQEILELQNITCRSVLIRPVVDESSRPETAALPIQLPTPAESTGEPTIVENGKKDFVMGSAEVDEESPKGTTSIEDMILPLALGAISTLFLVLIAVYFRGNFFKPIDYWQEIKLGKTQFEILEELSDAQKIPTDIATRVKKSKSTVIEHLEHLQKMGLIEKSRKPGRKFVYYKLSSSGKRILLKKNQAA